MSKIGNNIRKIRSVKNLNQSDFADLFELKRSSIGAYEEGRAEPKINTVIEIANYFGISTDDLLTKELSVNDLYRFDIFREDLANDTKHNLTPSTVPVDLIQIPYISTNIRKQYLKERKLSEVKDQITLPMNKGFNYIAIEITDNSMFHNETGINTNDILIGIKPEKLSPSNVQVGKVYIFETDQDILIREVIQKNLSSLELIPFNPNYYATSIPAKEIKAIWQVEKLISNNISNRSDLTKQLENLESEIRLLKRNLQ